jgi:hypothetical protein
VLAEGDADGDTEGDVDANVKSKAVTVVNVILPRNVVTEVDPSVNAVLVPP